MTIKMKRHSQPFSRLKMLTGNKELDTELEVLVGHLLSKWRVAIPEAPRGRCPQRQICPQMIAHGFWD